MQKKKYPSQFTVTVGKGNIKVLIMVYSDTAVYGG